MVTLKKKETNFQKKISRLTIADVAVRKRHHHTTTGRNLDIYTGISKVVFQSVRHAFIMCVYAFIASPKACAVQTGVCYVLRAYFA